MTATPPPSSAPTPPKPDEAPGGEPEQDGGPRLRGPIGAAFVALLAVGCAMLTVSGPLWLTLAGVVAALFGIVMAIVALARIRRAPRKGLVVLTAVIAILIGLSCLVGGGVRLALWDQVSAYETCVSDSVTISGSASCQQDLEQELRDALLPGSAPSAAPAGSAQDSASPEAGAR